MEGENAAARPVDLKLVRIRVIEGSTAGALETDVNDYIAGLGWASAVRSDELISIQFFEVGGQYACAIAYVSSEGT